MESVISTLKHGILHRYLSCINPDKYIFFWGQKGTELK